MARPRKYNADYFPHDSRARHDEKIQMLLRKYGHKGYAVWFMLLEKLTHSDYFTVTLDGEMDLEMMALDFHLESAQELTELLEFMDKLQLLTVNRAPSGSICGFLSQKLAETMESVLDKRRLSQSAHKVKKIKVKKIKGEEIKDEPKEQLFTNDEPLNAHTLSDHDRWRMEQMEPWARRLKAIGCKVGPNNWTNFKELLTGTFNDDLDRFCEIAKTLPASERWPDQIEDAFKKLDPTKGQGIIL